MKNLLLATVLMLSSISYGQWKTYEYKDEFGDLTGDTFEAFQASGIFSNSATTNSECGFLFKHDVDQSYTIVIYPYNGSTSERFVDNTFQVVKIKTDDGIKTIQAFVTDRGEVYFSRESYTELRDIISKPGDYFFLLNYEDDYSDSRYRFKFKTK